MKLVRVTAFSEVFIVESNFLWMRKGAGPTRNGFQERHDLKQSKSS